MRTTDGYKKILGIEGGVTFQMRMAMAERLGDNIRRAARGDLRAEAEIALLLPLMPISSDVALALLTGMNKRQIERFVEHVNPMRIAENSRVTVEVRWVGKIDVKRKTDGYYRLYLCCDDIRVPVHFSHRSTFIVYLIYLIDKKRAGEVDSLDIRQCKTLFTALMREVYALVDGEERFGILVNRIDESGNIRQARLKDCYADIRQAVSDSCTELGESPAPYILADAYDHLYVLRHNIHIHPSLLQLAGLTEERGEMS